LTQQANRWYAGDVASAVSCTQVLTGMRPSWSSTNCIVAWCICRRLLAQTAVVAFCRALAMAGMSSASSTRMTPMTTSSSTSVNP
jgi:hypothetical protein